MRRPTSENQRKNRSWLPGEDGVTAGVEVVVCTMVAYMLIDEIGVRDGNCCC